MIKIQLEVIEKTNGVDFIMKNFNDLPLSTIKELKTFALKRDGYFRYDLQQFGIKRRLNVTQILQIFEALEMNVTLIETPQEMEESPLCNQRIDFGKYKDFKWKEIPLNYLKWLYKENENKFAYEEMKRRKNRLPDIKTETIKIGKYKGRKWIDVPIDYLEWIVTDFHEEHEIHKFAKATLNAKKD